VSGFQKIPVPETSVEVKMRSCPVGPATVSSIGMRTFTRPPARRVGQPAKSFDWLVKPGRPYRRSIRTTGHQCRLCRAWFYTNHVSQTFCTVACWLEWLRAHSRRAVCPVCKCEFRPRMTPRGLQKRCSRRCYGISICGPTHANWKHGRYAKPSPEQIQSEIPV
jgi:hypothetical protein